MHGANRSCYIETGNFTLMMNWARMGGIISR